MMTEAYQKEQKKVAYPLTEFRTMGSTVRVVQEIEEEHFFSREMGGPFSKKMK